MAVPLCIVAAIATGVHSGFPTNWVLGVPRWFDSLDSWVTDHQSSNFFLHHIVGGFGSFLNDTTNWVVELLHWMTWLGVLLVATLIAWLVGSWRTALFSALMVASFGILQIPNGGPEGTSQMWPSAMTTLALMAVAIILSTLVGIPVGIASAVWPTVNKILRPVLDLMQILPAFAYLVPIVVLFSIGNPAGIIATFIYAVPPLVRFTEIGIRSVRKDVIEAAESFGATRRQVLAERAAAARGAGDHARAEPGDHDGAVDRRDRLAGRRRRARRPGAERAADPADRRGLHRRRPDRVHGDVARPHVGGLRPANRPLEGDVDPASASRATSSSAIWGATHRGDPRLALRAQPRRLAVELGLLGSSTTRPARSTGSRTSSPGISGPISSFLTLDILNPLQRWLSDLPWWLVAAVVGMVGWVRGGVRRGLLLAGCVVLLGLMQAPNGYTFQGTTSYNFVAWNDAMETLSLVLVALVLDLASGSRSASPPTAGGSSTRSCVRSSTSCRRCRRSST